MTEYVQLRDTEKSLPDEPPLPQHFVEKVSQSLLKAWFPGNQPMDKDLESWIEIAKSDATVAIRALLDTGLRLDFDSVMVSEMTNDERKNDEL